MHTVIMAGGSGTRFWPASRRKRPKQFLRITGDTPLVVETCNRLAPVARDEQMILVLGAEHMAEAGSLFKGRGVHLLGEPVGRNTAPCIGLGALYARHLGCQGPVAFMPADHYIADGPAFLNALQNAESAATEGGIVTLGIVPTRPETGYGYIRRGEVVSAAGEAPIHRVSRFVEKPDRATALAYLESRDYDWNAGIFVAKPEVILQEIEACLPDLFAGLNRLNNSLGTDAFEREMAEVYAGIEPVSFDYGVMEKTTAPVFVVPCECGWSDVGSWESLYELRSGESDPAGNLALGEIELVDCRNLFVVSQPGRLVACLGMEDCLVVDTTDALLVAPRSRSQEVREIVDALKQKRKESFL
jgi:mannose-1-phosphate guanylyltransferase